MVEAGANEVPEDVIIDAMRWAVENVQPALELQKELREKGVEEKEYELILPDPETNKTLKNWTK